jgi:hypothetical protein
LAVTSGKRNISAGLCRTVPDCAGLCRTVPDCAGLWCDACEDKPTNQPANQRNNNINNKRPTRDKHWSNDSSQAKVKRKAEDCVSSVRFFCWLGSVVVRPICYHRTVRYSITCGLINPDWWTVQLKLSTGAKGPASATRYMDPSSSGVTCRVTRSCSQAATST